MKTFKSLIVEDNRKASDLLKNKLIRYCPSVEVIDQTAHLDEAKEMLSEHDYHLPPIITELIARTSDVIL